MIHHYIVSKKDKRFIDKAAYLVGIMFPIFTLPQVYLLYTTQQADGLSLVTWAAYCVLTLLFLVYALVDRIKPLIVAELAWVIIDTLMIVGILMYR